jgi:hypothetical protein
MFLSHPVYLEPKGREDNSMQGKRGRNRKACMTGPARLVRHSGESWIASYPNARWCSRHPSERMPETDVIPYRSREPGVGNVAGGTRTNEVKKSMSGTPTADSIRTTSTKHGIAYGARALRQRSAHSSQRTGKPSTRPGGRYQVMAKGHRRQRIARNERGTRDA